MSKINVNTWEPESGTDLTLGASGDTVTIPSGATITNSGTATGFGLFSSYAIIADQKSQNTDGGTFTIGAWRERDLQTEIADPDGIVSISSNQFTLGAGTYLIKWVAPTWYVGENQSRLYNVTDASEAGLGMSIYSWAGGVSSVGCVRTTIAGSKAFTIEHYATGQTYATAGFGSATNVGTEQYTTVEIYKEA